MKRRTKKSSKYTSCFTLRVLHGFTLVEALVALTILTVALIPAFQQATTAINLSGSMRNSLIASNLAQEGLEVIRAIRDANWFAGNSFDGLIDVAAICSGGCLVQYDSTVPLPLGGNPLLKLDPVSGLYQYNAGIDTIFRRKMILTVISSHELKIVAEVSWDERTGTKVYSVEYHLFDWLQ